MTIRKIIREEINDFSWTDEVEVPKEDRESLFKLLDDYFGIGEVELPSMNTHPIHKLLGYRYQGTRKFSHVNQDIDETNEVKAKLVNLTLKDIYELLYDSGWLKSPIKYYRMKGDLMDWRNTRIAFLSSYVDFNG